MRCSSQNAQLFPRATVRSEAVARSDGRCVCSLSPASGRRRRSLQCELLWWPCRGPALWFQCGTPRRLPLVWYQTLRDTHVIFYKILKIFPAQEEALTLFLCVLAMHFKMGVLGVMSYSIALKTEVNLAQRQIHSKNFSHYYERNRHIVILSLLTLPLRGRNGIACGLGSNAGFTT